MKITLIAANRSERGMVILKYFCSFIINGIRFRMIMPNPITKFVSSIVILNVITTRHEIAALANQFALKPYKPLIAIGTDGRRVDFRFGEIFV